LELAKEIRTQPLPNCSCAFSFACRQTPENNRGNFNKVFTLLQ